MTPRAWLVLVASVLTAGAAHGSELPHAQAVRVESAPRIDGRVADDPAWAAAPIQEGFTQIEPGQGMSPSEKTRFRLAYDDAHIYIGVECLDSNPSGIVSRLTRRDRDIEGDWVAISIDSRNSRNSAFLFQLSAAGVQVDGQVYNDTESSLDWDAVWKGKVSRSDDGWTAEFAIPLSVLRFSRDEVQTWGFQVHRNVSRKREQQMWAYDGTGRTWGVSHFGYIDGLRGLRPRRTFELRPYVATSLVSRNAEGGGLFGSGTDAHYDPKFELGADGKIGLTSRFTLDLTVNPDFGQVEADQVVLNLSRFETFFPEKRPFFLEGTDIFATTIQLFYPRRIGRPAVGLGPDDTVDDKGTTYTVTEGSGVLRLWTAAKVAGEVGDHLTLGVLGALVGGESVTAVDAEDHEKEFELAPKRAFGVLRTRYALGNGSFVGLTGTSASRLGDQPIRRPEADHDGYVQAIDTFLKTADGRYNLQAQLAVSERVGGPAYHDDDEPCTEADAAADPACVPIARADGTRMGPGAVGAGLQMRSLYEDQSNVFKLEYTGHMAKFSANDLGFAPRFNLNEFKAIGGFMKNQPDEWTNGRGLFPFMVGSFSMDGVPQYLLLGADIDLNFKNFMFFSPEQWIYLPGTFDIYETLDGARFEGPMGWEGHAEYATNRAKAVSFQTFLSWNIGFGDPLLILSADSSLNVQAASNLELTLGALIGKEHNIRFYDCSTDSGKSCLVESGIRHYLFAELESRYLSLTLRGTLTLRPELSFQAYAQYFLADGDYSDYREIDTMGEHPEIRREKLRPSSFVPTEEDGFETASLNVNFVARWETRPGSTLYAVYTRAQESPYTAPRHLDRGPTEDVVLVKYVYFMN